MAILFDCVVCDIVAILATAIIGLITYLKWSFTYWEKKNVPYIEPKIPFGTMGNPLSQPKAFGELSRDYYLQYKAKQHKHVGMFIFSTPMYMPLDTEYIKNILAVDFDHFVDRGVYYNEKVDPLSAHLFSIEGTKWRNLRVKLTPTFTSGKLKMMFQTLVDCSDPLKKAVDDICIKGEPVDIKDVAARFTTDVIGSCAFGLDCNSFTDPNSEFRSAAKRVFNATKFESLKGFIAFSSPKLGRLLNIRLTPTEAHDFFLKVIKETVDYRESKNFVRKDFMQLLIELKKDSKSIDGSEEKGLSLEEIAAQAFIFFLAGFETSSTTMTFCLFELAMDQDIQQKVRDEINDVLERHGGKVTYDAVGEMKYMGQVIDETLRKYPAVPTLNRKCIQNYRVPGTDLVIEQGTPVIIPVMGLHHDPEHFSNPEEFDPDRFSDDNKGQIKPFTYLPFGEGPRNCIGLRFGLVQTKVGLTTLLKNFSFSLNDKTELPLKMDPYSFTLSTIKSIWLNVEKVQK